MTPTLNNYINEASGLLHQLDDVSNTLCEAIGDRASWQASARTAQENYDTTESAFIFAAMTGDSLVATGKNAESRNAARDAMLAAFRKTSHEWKTAQGAKEKLADSQSMVEQLEKRFAAVRIQAELVGAIIKALSGRG